MKIAFISLILLLATTTIAQNNDFKKITVKRSEVTNGVVIVTVQRGAAANQKAVPLELQCNKSMTTCNVPEPGPYVMVELPKNQGVYECANVDLFPASADPKTSSALGEYCMIEK